MSLDAARTRQASDYLPLNDENAQAFVEDWTPTLISQMARFRLPADLAEDAAQEALLRALRGLPNFRGEAKLSTWLYTIAWREGLRAQQRALRIAQRESSLEFDPSAFNATPADARLEAADQRTRFQCLLDSLPERQRLVLAFHYLEGMPVAEIAVVIDAPVGSVKAWLKRGRDTLRARFDTPSAPYSLQRDHA